MGIWFLAHNSVIFRSIWMKFYIRVQGRSRPDRDFRNRTGPDRIGTPDPVDRTGPDRIPDQDIDFFENFVVFFFYFSCF